MLLIKRMAALGAAGLAAGAAGAFAATTGALPLGPSTNTQQATFQGYYDAHKDAYLVTDVSTKAQASALHVNYSKELAGVKGAPAQYFISGQLSVFGSQPGEPDYNPLWEEFFVTWKAGAKPVLLTSDNQIKALAKKGKLTLRDAHVVLNAPIIKVGK